MTEHRKGPSFPIGRVVRSTFLMLQTRLGSLHAFEQSKLSAPARRWLGGEPPSADTMARVMSGVDADELRGILQSVFRKLKRNKGFLPLSQNRVALVIDGHESHTSYLRCCKGCLKREVETKSGPRTQYYHRYVAAHLVGRDFTFMVDIEPQRESDGEITAALVLYERVHKNFSRAYDVVLGDALYSCQSFWKSVLAKGKQVITVLKENCPTLLHESKLLMDVQGTVAHRTIKHGYQQIRDLSGCSSWWDHDVKVRVVSCLETKTIKRQLDGKMEQVEGLNWFWVSSFSTEDIEVAAFVDLARKRWTIENEGFNNLVTNWHADHVYRHEDKAFENFLLLTILAANVFRIFYQRNLKPECRQKTTAKRISNLIKAGIDADATVAIDSS